MPTHQDHEPFAQSLSAALEAASFPAKSVEDWRAMVEAELGEEALNSLSTWVSRGFAASPIYGQASPALPPRLRKRADRWLICQEHRDPRMERAGEAIANDLARGADAIWLVTGLEHGTRVLTAGDVREVLEKVDLATTPVFLEPQADALSVAACHVAYASSCSVGPAKLRGCFGADPLGALARAGTLPAGLSGARAALVSLARWTHEHAPNMRAVLVSTRAYHDAGAAPAQELAWSLATAVDYLRWMLDAGLAIDDAARLITFSMSVTGELVPEIAKLRALRLVWAKVLHASGAKTLEPSWLHVRTSARTRSRRDPWVNMLRATAETFAAVVGGADSVACAPFDEAIGPSDDFAMRVARNTQLVLRDESHIGHVDDPAGGSWLIESITSALADEAWTAFQDIEALGGMSQALRLGKISGNLDALRKELDRRSADRSQPIIGVSEFPNVEEKRVKRRPVVLADVEVELGNPFSQATPDDRHDALLAFAECLRDGSEPGVMMERALAAASTGVDIFSLGATLRAGKASLHLEPLVPYRPAASWESLRDRADHHAKKTGNRAVAAVVTVGPLAEHSSRTSWTQSLLAAGGLASVTIDGDTPETASAKLAEGEHLLAVISGVDKRYDKGVPALVTALKAKGARIVLVAGRPSAEQEAELFQRGVDGFLFHGGDVREQLGRIHVALGISS